MKNRSEIIVLLSGLVTAFISLVFIILFILVYRGGNV